jgi:hypothetical protein
VEKILQVSAKKTGACVLYEDDPEKLIGVIHYYQTEHFRNASCFCDAAVPGDLTRGIGAFMCPGYRAFWKKEADDRKRQTCA